MLSKSTCCYLCAVGYAFGLRLPSVHAADIYWVGYQNGCMVASPDVASFFHDDNWFNYSVPQADDRALFGTGFDPQNNRYPHYIYFGDSCIDEFACSNVTKISGGNAVVGDLVIQSDNWTFDFGTLALHACDLPGDVNGGLTLGNSLILGDVVESSGSPGFASLTINGPGFLSMLNYGGAYIAVAPNSAGQLSIGDGIVLTSEHLSVVGDYGYGSFAVSGNGTQWLNHGQLWVGQGPASRGSLSISSGGYVSTGYIGIVGAAAGGSGEVLVTGHDSKWEVPVGGIWLGNVGSGSLKVRNGGHVEVGDAGVEVGRTGFGELLIDGGGTVESWWGGIGESQGVTGIASVTGGGSSWMMLGGPLYVGSTGEGALNVVDGGTVCATTAFIGGQGSGNGSIVVRGPDSRFVVADGEISIGRSGQGTFSVLEGAQVLNGFTSIGTFEEGFGRATVSGSGSRWTTSGDLGYLWIGLNTDGLLSVEDGSQLITGSFASIGVAPTGTGAVTVEGQGSTWEVSNYIIVGEHGNGTLVIRDGGEVDSEWSVIAWGEGSIGEVTVQGGNSVWTNAGVLHVGSAGTGTLTVLDDGLVSSETVLVHQLSALQGNGTVYANVTNGGAVRPGLPIGALWLDGTFDQNMDGTTAIQLAGTYEYDQLVVFGQASLGGTLSIEILDGFDPSLGSSFRVILCNSVRSEFPTITGLDLGKGHTLMPVYRSNGLWLTVVRYGDLDVDGEIGLLDFAAFETALLGPDLPSVLPQDAAADFSMDGVVDLRDFASFQNAYGYAL